MYCCFWNYVPSDITEIWIRFLLYIACYENSIKRTYLSEWMSSVHSSLCTPTVWKHLSYFVYMTLWDWALLLLVQANRKRMIFHLIFHISNKWKTFESCLWFHMCFIFRSFSVFSVVFSFRWHLLKTAKLSAVPLNSFFFSEWHRCLFCSEFLIFSHF